MSRTHSRRGSFIGGNRSLSESSGLPSYEDQQNQQNQQNQQQQNQQLPEPKKNPEDIDEEMAAEAAFEFLAASMGKSKKDLGVDDLHEYLGRFGLMSREALKDELRVQSSPNNNSADASRRAGVSPMSNAPTPSNAATTGTVARGDFIDMVCHHQQQQLQQQQQGRGGSNSRARRPSDGSGTSWIDQAVERQQQRLAQQQQQAQRAAMMQSGGGGMQKSDTVVSILDPQHLDEDGNPGSSGDNYHDGNNGDGNGGGNSQTSYGHDMNESLHAIEQRLRSALDARANTPVPNALRMDHGHGHGHHSPGSGVGSDGSPSPGGRSRRSSTPGGERRAGTGVYNSMSMPSGQGFKPKVSQPRSRVGGSQGDTSHGSTAASPSAVLRRHQQQQLEALMAIRRGGGNLLQQRGASRGRAGGGGSTPSKMAGMTVVQSRK